MSDDADDDNLMQHVPEGWAVWGHLPPTAEPLELASPDGVHTIRVERGDDAYIGNATIAGDELGIVASSPEVIREWVLGLLERARVGGD